MYIYVYPYIFAYAYTYQQRVHVNIYIYIYKYTYAYTFAFTYPYILVHTYIEWFSQCKQDIGNKTRTSDRLSAMRLHRSMRWLSRRGTVHATSRDAND